MTEYKYYTNESIKATTGLVAAYNMIPSAGGVMTDISGEGNNGTISGGALLTKDGMQFDGVDDIITLSSALTLGKIHTVAFRGSISAAISIIVSDGSSTDYIYINTTTQIVYRVNNGTTVPFAVNTLALNTDYSIVITRSGTTMKCYVNGLLQDTKTLSNDDDWNSINNIGGYAGVYYDGEMSEVKFYNYAFTPTQAQNYHNQWVKPQLLLDFSNSAVGDVL